MSVHFIDRERLLVGGNCVDQTSDFLEPTFASGLGPPQPTIGLGRPRRMCNLAIRNDEGRGKDVAQREWHITPRVKLRIAVLLTETLIMVRFLERHSDKIIATVSCFDRLAELLAVKIHSTAPAQYPDK
jgi:hypothetical protein